MSKKTEQIYKEISRLEDLQNQISIINSLSEAKGEENEESRHLQNIEFEMKQAITSLKFWIDSLYSYNGKSTSNAKKSASKENGKKGGRPPKEITQLKRRKTELEEILIPELKGQKNLTLDFEREEKIESELENYNQELQNIEEKLHNYTIIHTKILENL